MPNLAATLKSEIRRLAAREVKRGLRQLRRIQKQVKALRQSYRSHRYALAGLKRRLVRIKAAVRSANGGRGGRGAPMSPESIAAMRRGLAMSRVQFAKLLGVSPGSIFGWEKGRTLPRGHSLDRLRDVRKMGVRAAKARIKSPASGRRRAARGRGRGKARSRG
jgi:putative transcriptional regulator